MESIKFSIRRALSSVSIGLRGKYTNVRFFVVDLPVSPRTFSSLFAEEYVTGSNFKKWVTVEKLQSVFGLNWNYFQYPNSTTRKRVIGNVQLHFRKKAIASPQEPKLNRYF